MGRINPIRKLLVSLFLCTCIGLLVGIVCPDSMQHASAETNTLRLPTSLQVIEAETFYGDKSLDFVVLPENVTEIGALAFSNSSIKSMIWGEAS